MWANEWKVGTTFVFFSVASETLGREIDTKICRINELTKQYISESVKGDIVYIVRLITASFVPSQVPDTWQGLSKVSKWTDMWIKEAIHEWMNEWIDIYGAQWGRLGSHLSSRGQC